MSQLLSLSVVTLAIVMPTPLAAQTEAANPLERSSDPLLPQPAIDRPLSPLELLKITRAIKTLNDQAQAALEAGNEQEAFALWYRELRLQRALGHQAEVKALGRVGKIAWQQNRQTELQNISDRLESLEQEVVNHAAMNPALLVTFANAYKEIHALNQAVAIYQQILVHNREQKDELGIETALKNLGQLHVAQFEYPQAAVIYEELLNRARAENDYFNEGVYLRQLTEIYTQGSQPQNALKLKQQLAENYLNSQQIERLPALKIAIASDYEALNQPEAASQNYQEAFSLAWSIQQLATAQEALQKLGALYRAYEQPTYALQVYQELLKVEQHVYDFYGLMKTYEQIGQIYLAQDDYPQALAAYRQALEIARSLEHQQDYFSRRIEEINQQMVQ